MMEILSILFPFGESTGGGVNFNPALFTVIFIVAVVAVVLAFIFWYRGRVFESRKRAIRKMLEREILQAERYHYAMGVLILEVPESTP